GKSSSEHVRRITGSQRRQCGQSVAPGKGISQQPMQQDDRRPGTGAQIAHPGAIQVHPALFHALSQGRRARRGSITTLTRGRTLLKFFLRQGQLFPLRCLLSKINSASVASFGDLRLPIFFAICPPRESQNPHPVSQNTRDKDGATSKTEAKWSPRIGPEGMPNLYGRTRFPPQQLLQHANPFVHVLLLQKKRRQK